MIVSGSFDAWEDRRDAGRWLVDPFSGELSRADRLYGSVADVVGPDGSIRRVTNRVFVSQSNAGRTHRGTPVFYVAAAHVYCADIDQGRHAAHSVFCFMSPESMPEWK